MTFAIMHCGCKVVQLMLVEYMLSAVMVEGFQKPSRHKNSAGPVTNSKKASRSTAGHIVYTSSNYIYNGYVTANPDNTIHPNKLCAWSCIVVQ